jgi:tRNA threonylcarbamoyladenosine biosynthesis protein TsaB
MAIILGIETSSSICSVALAKDGKLLAIRESEGVKEHSAALTGFIAEVFAEAGLSYNQIDTIAVSIGPGSYTGLRIGVSSAKGLSYALDKPIIAIDTLKSMAFLAVQKTMNAEQKTENALFIPMLDARRMEIYTAIYGHDLQLVEPMMRSTLMQAKKLSTSGRELSNANPYLIQRETIHFWRVFFFLQRPYVNWLKPNLF